MISITYTISNDKYDKYKESFLIAHPIPRDIEGNPIMGAGEWIKKWGLIQFKNAYKCGARMLAERNAIIDESIIE